MHSHSTPRKRFFLLISLAVAATTLFNACDTLKQFASRDLEEEDFIIGKLYEDELVKETLYVPPTPPGKPKKNSAFETAREGGKDMKLYAAVEPWMGTPYKYGGTTKQGVDCSAFVGAVYKEAYRLTLHRTANDMQQDVKPISRAELREGDLVFFVNSNKKVSHVGIYLHDGMFVHASTSNGVSISTLANPYWTQHFYRGGRRK